MDFPRSASFASVKLVLWWEEEYIAAFKKPSGFIKETPKKSDDNSDDSGQECGGMVKDSDPSKFVSLISKSADQLLGKWKNNFLKVINFVNSLHSNHYFSNPVCLGNCLIRA